MREYSLQMLDTLVRSGVKALVIACNSASSAVLRDARERYEPAGIPVLEVIHPAVRRAVAATRTGRVGVIGTHATISSRSYEDAFAAAPHLELFTQACPAFVEFVEQGITSGAGVLDAARTYLEPLREAEVDSLVLGCTHYPLLTGVISYVMGDGVTLVSSAEETAKDLYRTLTSAGLLRPDDAPAPRHEFLSTGDTVAFRTLARRFLGPEVPVVQDAVEVTGELPRLTEDLMTALDPVLQRQGRR